MIISNDIQKRERSRLLDLANEYKAKGYKVIIEPRPCERPLFLINFRPDLIAMSARDNVVFEVKTKNSFKDSDDLDEIAQVVGAQDNWRFELVITNPRFKTHNDISLKTCKTRLNEARRLLKQNLHTSSLLTAWVATESLLRKLIGNDKQLKLNTLPSQFVKTSYSLGLLSESEFDLLTKAAQARNMVVHGFEFPNYLPRSLTISLLINLGYNIISRLEPKKKYNDKTKDIVQILVDWFLLNYEDPAEGVPYEGEYIYIFGGPYDATEELFNQFPNVSENVIQQAVNIIHHNGIDWVKKGDY
jgi:REase_AHJR-like